MRFVFLRTVVAADASVGGAFVFWYLFFCDEEAGAGAFYITNSLEEATKFVGKASLPDVLVLVGFYQMTIFKDVTGDVVNDHADEVDGGVRQCGGD